MALISSQDSLESVEFSPLGKTRRNQRALTHEKDLRYLCWFEDGGGHMTGNTEGL